MEYSSVTEKGTTCWCLLQWERCSHTACEVKESRHRRTFIVLFYLYEASRKSKCVETADYWLIGTRWEWRWIANGSMRFFWGVEMFYNWIVWGTWVAQSVKPPTSAQVVISSSVSSSPTSGSVLTAQRLEPASDLCLSLILCLPLSLPLSCSCSVSLSVKNK